MSTASASPAESSPASASTVTNGNTNGVHVNGGNDGKKKVPADIVPWYDRVRSTEDFHRCCRKVRVTETESGRIVYELTLEREHVNMGGSAHGGLLMTVIDECSILSVWLLDHGDRSAHGVVTVNANISCISTALLGETIVFEAKVTKSGATLSYVTTTVTEKTTGRLVASGNLIAFTKTRGPYLQFTDLTVEQMFERMKLSVAAKSKA